MAIERVIGIDFGTSTSVIKVKTYKDGIPMDAAELANYVQFDGKDIAPTLIYLHKNGDILAEYSAETAADSGMGELCANFKPDLISPDKEIRSKALNLTKLFFQHVYKLYETQKTHFPKCDSEITYVSYPAKWPVELNQAMFNIVREAGFQNVKGLDEPTAAVHTVLVQQMDNMKSLGLVAEGKSVNILMVDMGAGTTDLVLCRYTHGGDKSVEILNTWPKADSSILFGGREIDGVLCDYVKDYLVRCGMPEKKDYRKMFLVNSKRWKEANVSAELRKKNGIVRICGFINPFMNMLDSEEEFPPINRACFERLLSGYIGQFPRLINDCIANTRGVAPEDVDLVILTGGHSQWYFANEILDGSLTSFGEVSLPKIKREPNRIIRLSRPHETVALGLVYQPMNVCPMPKSNVKVEPAKKTASLIQANKSSPTQQKNTSKWGKIASQSEAAEYARYLTGICKGIMDSDSFIQLGLEGFINNVGCVPCEPYLDKFNKKLSGALTYAKLVHDEYPLLLFDTTFWGSGKKGFLATTKALHATKCIGFSGRTPMSWADILEIERGTYTVSSSGGELVSGEKYTEYYIFIKTVHEPNTERRIDSSNYVWNYAPQLRLLKQIWQDLR